MIYNDVTLQNVDFSLKEMLPGSVFKVENDKPIESQDAQNSKYGKQGNYKFSWKFDYLAVNLKQRLILSLKMTRTKGLMSGRVIGMLCQLVAVFF